MQLRDGQHLVRRRHQDVDLDEAVNRVRSAVNAAKGRIVVTDRTDNFIQGRPDLDDTIRRLAAFAEAGADVLYAPFPTDLDGLVAIVIAVAPTAESRIGCTGSADCASSGRSATNPRRLAQPGLRHHLLAPTGQPLTLLGVLRASRSSTRRSTPQLVSTPAPARCDFTAGQPLVAHVYGEEPESVCY
ncbi:isocitrate lyase/phosphoenolpyruvate mutase family protein [Streptomyces sp. NPDC004546]|uniref:isocitrate lyase/phosphoenolpyruvate mutase family protein n=1 Tax=Streptomyces sp. NPDC004546 TaxID=3154282 RepID=UPI0033AB75EE